AELSFAGLDRLRLDAITATAGGGTLSGDLALATRGTMPFVTGQLSVDWLALEGVAAALLGPAALIGTSDAIWPVGPIATGDELRAIGGRIGIEAETVRSGGR